MNSIKIVRIQQELHATSCPIYKKSIYKLTGIKPQEYIIIKNKINSIKKKIENQDESSLFYNVIFFTFSCIIYLTICC